MKRLPTILATGCMVAMTIWPLVNGTDAASINEGISWFWAAWAIVSVRFLIVGVTRWQDARSWARARTVNLASALILLGADTVRIRLDVFDGWLSGDGSTVLVYMVRLYVGWSFVVFMAMVQNYPQEVEH